MPKTLPIIIASFVITLAAMAGDTGAVTAKASPHRYSPFGTEGETTPEMLAALNRMSESGVVEGRKGSLQHFRWSGTPPKLTHLGLWGSKVDNEALALSALLPDLQFVSLYETNVNDQGLEALIKLPKLRYVTITRIDRYEKTGFGPPQWSYPFMPRRTGAPVITGQGLKILARITALEGLDLFDTQLSSSDLAVLSSFPKLGSLSLPNTIDTEAAKHLQASRKLSNLTLGNREIKASEIECLAAWKSLRNLTLIHAQLPDEVLQTFSKLESLTELHLVDCGLTDERLAKLRTAPKLLSLDLSRNEINGPGLASLVKLNLRSLDLTFNNLRNETLTHLPQLSSLENLYLGYSTGVTDQGIRSGTLQSMTHLKELRIRGMKKITDEALDDLVRFSHLEDLNIRETGISAAGVERMKRDMPKTVVFK